MASQYDQGHVGFVALDGSLNVSVQCRPASGVPTTPDAAPTYAIYSQLSDTPLLTGSLSASDANSKTGFRRGTVTCSTANGFASGGLYVCRVSYAVSSTNFVSVLWFNVV